MGAAVLRYMLKVSEKLLNDFHLCTERLASDVIASA